MKQNGKKKRKEKNEEIKQHLDIETNSKTQKVI